MKHLLPLSILSLALVACTDTTGLSGAIHQDIHPDSSENAAVTVAEFADLQCPACKSAHSLVVKPVIEQYGAQIRYEFHHFPLSSIHRFAMDSAEASECAADQGKFWDFVDLAYEKQEELSKQALDQWGEDLQLDTTLYNRCRRSHIKREAIMAEYDQGKELGVTGTPTFFVNGKRVESTVEAIGAAITEAVGNAGRKL